MASNINIGTIIEPWSGSGWPLSLFVDQEDVTKHGSYVCANTKCTDVTEDGQEIRRIVRVPYRLNCQNHHLCEECYDLKRSLPEDQRGCKTCENEPFDDDVRTQSVQAVLSNQVVDKQVGTQPELPNQTDEWQLEARDCSFAGKDEKANRQLNLKPVRCPYDCGITSRLTIGNIEKHMNACEQRLVPCEKCAEVIRYSQMAKHAANICPLRPVVCPNKSGKKGLKGNELTAHRSICEQRLVPCEKCAEGIRNPQMAKHVANTCPLRPVVCPNRCGKEGLKGKDFPEHVVECRKLPLVFWVCTCGYQSNDNYGAAGHPLRCVGKFSLHFIERPSSSSFQRPQNEMNIAAGCPQFAELLHAFSTEDGVMPDGTRVIQTPLDRSYQAHHEDDAYPEEESSYQ